MKQVTVIVPIYNVEKYLRTCFDSLLKQTSRDFSVLAVNDGSPDNSLQIMREYEAKYPDLIEVLDKENGGYGSVLETAVARIRTPYFLVCDPDDTLEPSAVETLLSTAGISGADLTVGAKTFVYEASEDRDYDAAYNTEFVTLKSNTVYHRGTPEFDDLFFIDPSPHAKLYKTEKSRRISFPRKVGYTDNLLFYMNLLQAETVIYTDTALANYLIDRTGNSMGDVRFKAMSGEIEVFQSILEQAEQLSDVPDIFWYRMFESFKFILYKTRRLACTKEEYAQILDQLELFLKGLLPHARAILTHYRKYSRSKIIEQIRDRGLLTGSSQKAVYARLKRKMVKEFTEPHD